MQTPVTNVSAILFGASASGGSTGIFTELGADGDLFSQLLTGFGTATGQGQQQLPGGAPEHLLAAQTNLLAANTLHPVAEEASSSLLAQEITPETAEKLLATMDGGTFGDPSHNEMLAHFQQQLRDMVQSAEPKTVGELVQAVTATKTDGASGAKATQPGNFQRALSWLQAALKKTTEADSASNASVQPVPTAWSDPNLQSLQASHFRPSADADTGTNRQAQTDEESKTKIEIVPAAQTILLPQWVAAIAPEKPADSDADSLPEVELPHTGTKTAHAAEALSDSLADARANAVVKDAAIHGAAAADYAAFKEHLATQDAYSLADNNPSPVVNAASAGGHVQTQTIQATQAISTVSLPHGVVNHAPVAEQVHVAISRAKKDSIDHITLQLEPAHLGRIEVQMRMGSDGQTQITFLADKAETFDALSRDAHALERSLQEAGIKADAGSMQFNLRQQPQPNMGAEMGFGGGNGQFANADEDLDDPKIGDVSALLTPLTSYYSVNVQEGVDIRA